MTTMNDFNYTDDVDYILASTINNVMPSVFRAEYSNAETLSGTRTLLDADTPIQRFNCNGANRIVKMPTADTTTNHPYVIYNSTSSGTYTITIQNNGATVTYAIIDPSNAAVFIPDGNGGYVMQWAGSISWAELTEQGSTPATPASGRWRLYYKSDGLLYQLDDAGSETVVGSNSSSNSDGWVALNTTLTYSSADDPIYVVSSNANLSSVIQVGDKMKFTNNSTTFYGIVHALGSWSGSAQLITLYGGTDYDVANSAITAPYYSKADSPQGFPKSKAKWSVTLTNSTDQTQNTPTQNNVYNPSSLSIVAPIGVWDTTFIAAGWATSNAAQTSTGIRVGLSTSSSSYSDSGLIGFGSLTGPSAQLGFGGQISIRKPLLTITSKTTYYVVMSTPYANMTNIILYNSSIRPLEVTLTSVYL